MHVTKVSGISQRYWSWTEDPRISGTNEMVTPRHPVKLNLHWVFLFGGHHHEYRRLAFLTTLGRKSLVSDRFCTESG